MLIEETDTTLVDTSTGDRWMMTTSNVMLLKDKYPVEQLWLPFIQAIFCVYEEPPKKVSKKRTLNVNRKYHLTSEHQTLYIPEMDVHQMILPFGEFQIPSGKIFKRLLEADFPAFHRDMHGYLYATTFSKKNTDVGNERIRSWIAHNCMARVAIRSVVLFEDREDYLLAILSGHFSDYREGFHKTHRPPPREFY